MNAEWKPKYRYDAFWLIEYPVKIAMLSAEMLAARMRADMARAEEQRAQADKNAKDFAELMKRYSPNTSDDQRSAERK